MPPCAQSDIFGIVSALFASVEACFQFCHVLVELVEIYVGENRTDDAALRCSTVASVQLTIFHVSCVQKFTDETQEAFIRYFLFQNFNHDVMVNVVKEAFDVSLDKPFAPCKSVLYLSQSCVTASVGSEAVRCVFKATLIHRFEQHTYHFLHELVINGRYSQRSLFSIFLRNVCPS